VVAAADRHAGDRAGPSGPPSDWSTMPRPHAARLGAGVALGTALAGVGLLAAPTALAESPLPPISLSAAAIAPGETLTVSGSGCTPAGPDDLYTSVHVYTTAERPEQSGRPAEDGTWSVDLTFYASTPPGVRNLYATCAHDDTGRYLYPVSEVAITRPDGSVPERLPRPTVSPATVEVGQPVTVSGTGCPTASGQTLPTSIHTRGPSSFHGAAEVQEDGSWTMEAEQGEALQPGTYDLQVGCDSPLEGGDYPVVPVTVVEAGSTQPPTTTPPTTTPPAETPSTGSPTQPPATAAPSTPPAAVTTDARGTTVVTAAPGQSLTPTAPVTPGTRLQLVLTGYTPGEEVRLVLHSTPRELGVVTADARGVLTVDLTVPTGIEAGDHRLVATRADGSVVEYAVRIATAGAAADAARLAYTGADVAVPLGAGALLVVLGAATCVVARRRRTAA
jgi:hypothetical protein